MTEEEQATADRAHASRTAYYTLVAELEDLEATTGLYLADEGCDQANALTDGREYNSVEFWDAMTASAKMAAGERAHEDGYDINDMIGRVIY